MRVDVNGGAIVGLGAIVGVAVGVWWLDKQLTLHPNALNPTSSQNLAYQGVNSVGAALTGNKNFDLGVWFYNVTHPNQPSNTTPIP